MMILLNSKILILEIHWLLLWPLKFLGNIIVFRKIKAMLGKNFRAGVAGGGAFPPSIDEFFWAIGVNVVEGYGLTETAPVVSVRPLAAPIFRTIGSPIRGVQARIVDMDGYVLGRCKEGILQIKGPTVMKGYISEHKANFKEHDDKIWLHTGDLGYMDEDGFVYFKSQRKRVIMSDNNIIYPNQIEEIINIEESGDLFTIKTENNEYKTSEEVIENVFTKPFNFCKASASVTTNPLQYIKLATS